jgi:predicted PurR-regulated permease PerM
MDDQVRTYARITLVALIFIGATWVLAPFLTALLSAAILYLSSWPLFQWIKDRLGGRNTLSATLMTFLLALAVLLPMSYIALALTNHIPPLIARIQEWLFTTDRPPPSWLESIPLIGKYLTAYWLKIAASREELIKLGQYLFVPTRNLLWTIVGFTMQGLLQLTLVVFITFFFYLDGNYLTKRLITFAETVGGGLGSDMLVLAHNTTMSVMIGWVATSAAQAFVLYIGVFIAGVPGAPILAGITFFLCLIPMVGAPIIWINVAWWLYSQGDTGLAIFMVMWGVIAIGSIEYFVKPILICHTSKLHFLVVMLGVFGGVLAFGFVGIFLGPVVLSLGLTLINRWSEPTQETLEQP